MISALKCMTYYHPNPKKTTGQIDCLPISRLVFEKNKEGEIEVTYRMDRGFPFKRVLFIPKFRVDQLGNEGLKIYCSYKKSGEWVLQYRYINLTSTPCYFGGFRRWFVCECDRRIASLYFLDGKFGCHECHRLTYETRTCNSKSLTYLIQKMFWKKQKLDTLNKQMKKRYYRGRPTKGFQKTLRLSNELVEMITSLGFGYDY